MQKNNWPRLVAGSLIALILLFALSGLVSPKGAPSVAEAGECEGVFDFETIELFERSQPHTWQATFVVPEGTSSIILEGFVQQGHPERGCPESGHDSCGQNQPNESLIGLVNGEEFYSYSDYPGGPDDTWIPFGPITIPASAGTMVMTWVHPPGDQSQGPGSTMAFGVVRACVAPTPTPTNTPTPSATATPTVPPCQEDCGGTSTATPTVPPCQEDCGGTSTATPVPPTPTVIPPTGTPVPPTETPVPVVEVCEPTLLNLRQWEALAYAASWDTRTSSFMNVDGLTVEERYIMSAARWGQALPTGLTVGDWDWISDWTQIALVQGEVTTNTVATYTETFSVEDIGRFVYREDFERFFDPGLTPGKNGSEFEPVVVEGMYQIPLDLEANPYFVDQIWTTNFIGSIMLQGHSVLEYDPETDRLTGQLGNLWTYGYVSDSYTTGPAGREFLEMVKGLAAEVDQSDWYLWFEQNYDQGYVRAFGLVRCLDPNVRQHWAWLARTSRSQYAALEREDAGWSFHYDMINPWNGFEEALTNDVDGIVAQDFFNSTEQPGIMGSTVVAETRADGRIMEVDLQGRNYPVSEMLDEQVIRYLLAQGEEGLTFDGQTLGGNFIEQTRRYLGEGSEVEEYVIGLVVAEFERLVRAGTASPLVTGSQAGPDGSPTGASKEAPVGDGTDEVPPPEPTATPWIEKAVVLEQPPEMPPDEGGVDGGLLAIVVLVALLILAVGWAAFRYRRNR